MKTVLTGLTLLLTILATGNTFASDDYLCTIKRLDSAKGKSNGENRSLTNAYIGKQFSVERVSGIMSGVLKNSFGSKPQIIDIGSKENSYKVVATLRLGDGGGVGSNIQALVVNEYEKTQDKSFVFLDNDTVFTGICTHY